MRKKIGLVLGVSTIVSFIFPIYYNRSSVSNYNAILVEFASYIFLWSLCLFVSNLLSFKLDIGKYKKWLMVSIIIMIFSIVLAYKNNQYGNSLLTFDGSLTTSWTAIPYSIISLIYFIIDFFKTRTK